MESPLSGKTAGTYNWIVSKSQVFRLLVVVALCQYTLFDYVRVIISKLPIMSVASYLFFPALYIFLILLSFSRDRVRWIRGTDMLLVGFFALAIAVTCIVYPTNSQFISQRFMISIFPCLQFFVLGLCLDMDEEMLKMLGTFSSIAIILAVLYLVYYMSTGRELGSDELGRAYGLLPNVMITMLCSFKRYRKAFAVFAFAGIVFIVAMGTRGPIVILAAYLIINIYRYARNSTKNKVFLTLLIVPAVLLFTQTPLYLQLLKSMSTAIRSAGFSTRIIEYLMNGDMVSDTSGRDSIYLRLLGLFMERPFLGYGVYGEWQFVNYSAHNIYIETIFQYGVILGPVMLIAYLIKVIKAYKKTHNEIAGDWILLWATFTLIRGVFGGELLSFYVFFLLGFCLKEIRMHEKLEKGLKIE